MPFEVYNPRQVAEDLFALVSQYVKCGSENLPYGYQRVRNDMYYLTGIVNWKKKKKVTYIGLNYLLLTWSLDPSICHLFNNLLRLYYGPSCLLDAQG